MTGLTEIITILFGVVTVWILIISHYYLGKRSVEAMRRDVVELAEEHRRYSYPQSGYPVGGTTNSSSYPTP